MYRILISGTMGLLAAVMAIISLKNGNIFSAVCFILACIGFSFSLYSALRLKELEDKIKSKVIKKE